MRIKKIIKTLFHPIKRHNENSKVSERFHDVEIISMTLDTGISNKVRKFMISKVNWGTTIKFVSMIFIVGFFFVLPTYAQETTSVGLQGVQSVLEKLLSLCSRGWIVLAILAGKLMTNDFVYGAFMHMDIYLWKIRNIMKNFANFALIGLVLVSIVKNLIGNEALDVKKVITNTLVAGILIQASWFLMGAVIDISTVATAGIGAFPTSFLRNDTDLQNKIKTSITKFQADRPIIDFNATGNNIIHTIKDVNTNLQSSEETRENILPSYNSVSGPFIYLGMGVFHFQNYLTTENSTGVVPLTLGFALRLVLLLLFTVALLLLLIANIMRIGLLWVFIIGSPFLILSQVFNIGKGGSSGLSKIFSIKNLIATAFKPVIFVAGISLMLIVIVSMQTSITGSGATRQNDLNGVSMGMSGSASTLTVEGISDISVNQTDILGKNVIDAGQNFFSQLIMLLLTIFIMRRFVKLSLTLGGGTIGETMEKLTGLAERFAKSAPVLPGGSSFTAAKSVMSQNATKTIEGMGIDAQGNFGKRVGGNFETNESKFNDMIGQKWFGELPSWKPQDYEALEDIAKTGDSEAFFAKSQELAKERNLGLSVNDAKWITAFESLSDPTGLGFTGPLPAKATPEQIQKYFSDSNNIKALYNAMGGPDASKASKPKDYDELKNMSFYAKK